MDNEKKAYDISEEAQKSTMRCEKGYSCLNRGAQDLCKVERYVGKGVVVIKCKNDKYCPYRMSFGGVFLCHCPIRMELFNRYNI